MARRITNCHIHTFTLAHVPARFLPAPLDLLLRTPYLWRPARWLLTYLNPFDDRDKYQRYTSFVRVASRRTQREIYEGILPRYPQGTRFVVLPMDMSYMGAGAPPTALDAQHDELARLRDLFPDTLIPFAAVDPRRPDVAAMLRTLIEERGFKGIKVYPSLGYAPDHPVLMELWAYAAARGLPVMAHCSRGGVRQRGLRVADLERFTAPHRWRSVLEAFPTLRVCLAHMGGGDEWERYFREGHDAARPPERASWLAQILEMLRDGRYPGLYTDISYTLFAAPRYAAPLAGFLADPRVAERVLFGSDYYMAERERADERGLSIRLRRALGEDLWWRIAEVNPAQYLGEAR
jgi:predicted TIM-barrel fold metal-dependent hydrolase